MGVPDHHGVYSLFVNMRNPKIIDFGGKEFDRFGTPKYEVATNEAIDNGERGILFDTLEEAEAYIAEHPEEDLDYVEKYTTSDDLLVQAKEEGYDGVIYTNLDGDHEFVSLISNQFKSADPVTYDDNGNVIPLSERFNLENDDIRYSDIHRHLRCSGHRCRLHSVSMEHQFLMAQLIGFHYQLVWRFLGRHSCKSTQDAEADLRLLS